MVRGVQEHGGLAGPVWRGAALLWAQRWEDTRWRAGRLPPLTYEDSTEAPSAGHCPSGLWVWDEDSSPRLSQEACRLSGTTGPRAWPASDLNRGSGVCRGPR